jgi:hypothetical protein
MFAHGGGRGKAEATVGELEANAGEAVVAGALEVRRRGVVEEAATASSGGGRSIAGSRSGCLHAEVLRDGGTTSTHACAFCASTDEGVGVGRRKVCRKLGRQHLDAQKLLRGVLANARRGTANVEAVARTREKARSRTIDGVAPKLAAGTLGDGAEDRAGVTRLLWPIDDVPHDTVVGSGRKSGDRIEHHAHWCGCATYSVRQRGGKGTAASMDITPNKHDVGAAPTLAAAEAERVETHKVWHVSDFVAGLVDRL